MVRILVIGSGGREHALVWKLKQSPRVSEVFVAPGNGGTAREGAINVAVDAGDLDGLVELARKEKIDLVVPGPELPLTKGITDRMREAGIPCFGPDAYCARLEGSKAFAKDVMNRAGVPTAHSQVFTDPDKAKNAVVKLGAPLVVKADGLAAGKGVIVAKTTEEALEGVHECFSGAFGQAGATVVVEEMMEGPECSLLALTDGKTLVPLATSQDHKRALDGDLGPNTGGMGVYSPVPMVTPDELAQMIDVEKRVVAELAAEGITYSGCLYGGFRLTKDGPKVPEFNARFGDPETQVVLPRMKGDLVEAFLACDNGTLSEDQVAWDDDWAVSVVLTSAGYPGKYEKGKAITGIDRAEQLEGVTVYHAGTKVDENGQLVTNGGRVLDVTAVAPTFEAARAQAYAAVELIDFEGKTFRTDIGMRAIKGREA